MKKLINKLAHACGLYTADDVEHIETHWRERLDKATTAEIKLVAGGGGGGSSGGKGIDRPSAGGKGGPGQWHTPSWYSRAAEPLFISSTAPQGQTLIINPVKPLDNPSVGCTDSTLKVNWPQAKRSRPGPLHKGALRMTSAERRELAAEAARWCEQQRIETSPENIIFYLNDRRMISAPTPGTADL